MVQLQKNRLLLHLANVVDDHWMKITHVVRAAEWMPSIPKHIALYEAFGWTPPNFAHVGLLQDEKGQKLSKRNADVDIAIYKERGILPETLVNFCVLLGWSHNEGVDFMQMEKLVKIFNLKFTKGNTVVKMDKLWYLQKQHVSLKCEKAKSSGSTEPIKEVVTQVRKEAEAQFPKVIKDCFATQSSLEEYCRQVLLGCSHDNQYARLLNQYKDDEALRRVTLLEGAHFEKDLAIFE